MIQFIIFYNIVLSLVLDKLLIVTGSIVWENSFFNEQFDGSIIGVYVKLKINVMKGLYKYYSNCCFCFSFFILI